MRTLTVILALAIVYLAVKVIVFRYNIWPYRSLPAPDQSAEVLGSGPSLKLIVAGDSIGVGVGASSKQTTYGYSVAKSLAKTSKVEYKNIAVNGYKTSDVLQKQVSQIIAFHPDIVLISMGGNDATHLKSAESIISNYKNIIAQLEQGTSAKIYISDIPNFSGATTLPWLFRKLIEFRSKSINQKLLALSDARATIVNIHDFGDYGLAKTPKGIFSKDCFHPNDRGYQNWTNAFLEKITR